METLNINKPEPPPPPAVLNQDQRQVSQNWVDARIRIYNLKKELASTIVALALRWHDREG